MTVDREVALHHVQRLPAYLLEATLTTLRNLRAPLQPAVPSDRVRDYFEARSGDAADNFDDFVDSSGSDYALLYARAGLSERLRRSDRVVDLGCGRAGVLKRSPFSGRTGPRYLGFDIDRVAIEALAASLDGVDGSRQFMSGSSLLDLCAHLRAGDILLASNVLPYCEDLEASGFLALCRIAREVRAPVVVVDPLPGGPTWELAFGGLRLAYRTPEVVQAAIEATGLALESRTRAYACRILGRLVVPISYAAIFSPPTTGVI